MNRDKKNLKGRKRSAFFTGRNSTCQAHISCHYNVYKECCKENGILENHHAIPWEILKEMEEEKLKGKKQVKINNILEKSTTPQEFTHEGVLHAVVQFVACDDQVLLDVLMWNVFVILINGRPWQWQERSISQLFSSDEAKSSLSRHAKYSQHYDLYPQPVCQVVKGTEKRHNSEKICLIEQCVPLTQWEKGGTREIFFDSQWMDSQYYKSVIPWDDGPLDRGEGRNLEVEIRSSWL